MQRLVQSFYIACAFVVFLAFATIAVSAIMQQPSTSASGIVQVNVDDDEIDIEEPEMGLTVEGDAGMSECDVIFQMVARNVEYFANDDEWLEEDLAALHYAVYTCIERLPSIYDYI